MKPPSIAQIAIGCLLACALYSGPGLAGEVRELGWDDLVPPQTFDDPFEALTPDQLYDLATVARTRGLARSGDGALSEETLERATQLERELERQGIDVDGLLGRRAEITELRRAQSLAVVDALDGQNVLIPGYVLPLEFDGERVVEFFLVPYVGACMHAPTPPPNQMVHVSVDEGFVTSGLYEPVWVRGVMSTREKTSAFGFSDGTLDLTTSYTMKALEITPYR